MKVETLRDVLHWTSEFHQHLSECLKRGADKTDNTRAQMLLNYLSEHEEKLLHDCADISSAKELMEDLRSFEEHEIMVMSQSANRLEDI